MVITLFTGREFFETELTRYRFFTEENEDMTFSFGFEYYDGPVEDWIENKNGEETKVVFDPLRILLGNIDRRINDPYKVVAMANSMLICSINDNEIVINILGIGVMAYKQVSKKDSEDLGLTFPDFLI